MNTRLDSLRGLRRYRIEWYDEIGGTRAREQLAADAADALTIFRHNTSVVHTFGFKPGQHMRIAALADDACAHCVGLGRFENNKECSTCNGLGIVPPREDKS